MKKILFVLAVVSTFFMGCDPEVTPFAATFSTNSITETGSATANKAMTTVLTNATSTSGSVSWSFSESNTVTGWTYSISVNGSTQSGTSGSFDIAGNSAATIIVTVSPNGTDGTGTASMTFTEGSNSLGTVSYSYTASTTPPAPNFSLSITNDTSSALASSSLEYKTVFTNLSSDSIEITWIRIEDAGNPATWSYTTCDHITCWAPFITEKTNKVAGNHVFDFKTEISPNSATGTGTVTTLLFEPSDSAGTVQTHTIVHTAN